MCQRLLLISDVSVVIALVAPILVFSIIEMKPMRPKMKPMWPEAFVMSEWMAAKLRDLAKDVYTLVILFDVTKCNHRNPNMMFEAMVHMYVNM